MVQVVLEPLFYSNKRYRAIHRVARYRIAVLRGGTMNQKELNAVNIKEWEADGKLEIGFQLKLTAKHSLAVGKWEDGDEFGIDLRRFSYHESRLLAQGIALTNDNWQKIYNFIHSLHSDGYFTDYGDKDKSEYEKTIEISDDFKVTTEVFENFKDKFFCINMKNSKGKPIVRGPHTFVGIMVRFDTVSDFLNNCQSNNLVKTKKPVHVGKRSIDKKTGRKVY
jgi:hypothetical protein